MRLLELAARDCDEIRRMRLALTPVEGFVFPVSRSRDQLAIRKREESRRYRGDHFRAHALIWVIRAGKPVSIVLILPLRPDFCRPCFGVERCSQRTPGNEIESSPRRAYVLHANRGVRIVARLKRRRRDADLAIVVMVRERFPRVFAASNLDARDAEIDRIERELGRTGIDPAQD